MIKNILKLIFFSILSFCLVSCGNVKSNKTDSKQISFEYLKQGNLYGAGDENCKSGVEMIETFDSMQELIGRMNSINQTITEESWQNPIFFQTNSILAVFDTVIGNGGNRIEIEKISHHNDTLLVLISRNHPEGPSTLEITQPYVLAKINKQKIKHIKFVKSSFMN